jgi:hypothetical protein
VGERFIAVQTEYTDDWVVVDLHYRWHREESASWAKIVTPVMREDDAKLLADAKNAAQTTENSKPRP